MAARRAVNPSRRLADSGSVPLASSLHQKSRTSPLLSIGLVIVGAFLLIGYSYRDSGGFAGDREAIRRDDGGSCTSDVLRAIPILKKAYGDSMHNVLHVGPDTCKVVANLLKEDEIEAWGVEPYDLEDVDSICKTLVHKGFVRLADIKFPLPYRPKSFSLVIVSDVLDYSSPRYLNKTLPDLARVSADGLVIFTVRKQVCVSMQVCLRMQRLKIQLCVSMQVSRELRFLSCQNLEDRPNYGVHPGGCGILFRLAWKRTDLS